MEEQDKILQNAQIFHSILNIMKDFQNDKSKPKAIVTKAGIKRILTCEDPEKSKLLGITKPLLLESGGGSSMLAKYLETMDELKLVTHRDAKKEDEREIKEWKKDNPISRIQTNLTGHNIQVYTITGNGEKLLEAYDNVRKILKTSE
ncbi:hypothetical protein OAK30_02610 [Candidatus Nitrosopelagicus sp.]|nr:hypothetical protein [Candidatus Nitrosopelagicus sp.]